ncbi:MAG: transposase [Bacteroidetes bacterium]|nr:transposase [Bacteroidota bacterium]
MKPLLENDRYYHIYNRGNNYENIFIKEKDYLHFLKLLEIFILPVADIYAWCLMKNHFHLLVRIKEEKEIGYLNSKNAKSENPEVKWATYLLEKPTKEYNRKPNVLQQFKHIFNAYASWFNINHPRRGSLFEFNYKRKLVESKKQLINLIVYIHCNPVHHGFVDDIIEYPWTSYDSILSDENSFIDNVRILNLFDDKENFKYVHRTKMNFLNQELNGLELE